MSEIEQPISSSDSSLSQNQNLQTKTKGALDKIINKIFLKLNLLTLLFISSCAFSPGMSPKLIEEENIYNNLKLNFYDIEDINLNTLPKYSEKYKNDQRNLEEIISNNEYRYLIGPGDKIKITLTDIEDINGEYVIDSDGLITLPYAGKVNVVDQTKIKFKSI